MNRTYFTIFPLLFIVFFLMHCPVWGQEIRKSIFSVYELRSTSGYFSNGWGNVLFPLPNQESRITSGLQGQLLTRWGIGGEFAVSYSTNPVNRIPWTFNYRLLTSQPNYNISALEDSLDLAQLNLEQKIFETKLRGLNKKIDSLNFVLENRTRFNISDSLESEKKTTQLDSLRKEAGAMKEIYLGIIEKRDSLNQVIDIWQKKKLRRPELNSLKIGRFSFNEGLCASFPILLTGLSTEVKINERLSASVMGGKAVTLHHMNVGPFQALKAGFTVHQEQGHFEQGIIFLNGKQAQWLLYHQQITNAFRQAWPYSQGAIKDPAVLKSVMDKVYKQFPLPPGYGY